jgi:hypothetical protein
MNCPAPSATSTTVFQVIISRTLLQLLPKLIIMEVLLQCEIYSQVACFQVVLDGKCECFRGSIVIIRHSPTNFGNLHNVLVDGSGNTDP